MDEAPVLITREGAAGVVTLNRPKALNSLNLDMVRAIDAALDQFEADPAIACVAVTGAGERGLCAGGDIRMVHGSGRAGDGAAERFWFEEYRLNVRIAHFAKPYVALMDGITMGGGVGISAHGSHRIATERLKLAMPETGIGFFPDVGATWLLSRAPGELGTFLGLTGQVIGAADAMLAGLVDAHVASDRLADLRAALAAIPPGEGGKTAADAVNAVVRDFASEPAPSQLTPHLPLIDRCFGFDTVEQIVAALVAEADPFAAEILAGLAGRSPTALKITLRMLRLARQSASLEPCINREYAGACAILTLDDFYEGVRAAVIDKDRNPVWSPARLEDVTEAAIARFFEPHATPPIGEVG